MENVLELYAQEPEKGRARVCFDERPCLLLKDVVEPLPVKKGKPAKEGSEYERKGTAVILLAYDIDTGQRYLQVRKRRTKQDFAQFMEWLAKEHYQHVRQIALVQDNLNTHSYGSFYENMPAAQASGLSGRHIQLSLHAKTWELAQYGRDRVFCTGKRMPEQKDWQHGSTGKRGTELVREAQQ